MRLALIPVLSWEQARVLNMSPRYRHTGLSGTGNRQITGLQHECGLVCSWGADLRDARWVCAYLSLPNRTFS